MDIQKPIYKKNKIMDVVIQSFSSLFLFVSKTQNSWTVNGLDSFNELLINMEMK